MIKVSSKGSFDKTEKWAKRMKAREEFRNLERFGQKGVQALSRATPKDSSMTSRMWKYRLRVNRGRYILEWYNENEVDGQMIAILIQYGHGTGTGGYVPGRDYINPAIQPILDEIAQDVWKLVVK